MDYRIRIFLIILLTFGIVLRGSSQEVVSTCEETLRKAEDEFNSGRFFGIPSILSDCLPQFSRDQSFRAFLLLTQTYLLIDDQANAEKSYLKVLEANPEFVPNELTESIDIVNMSKNFTSSAILTTHGKVGLVFSMPRVVWNPGLAGREIQDEMTPLIGLNLGGGVEWNITERWGLGSEVFFGFRRDRINQSGFFQSDQAASETRMLWLDLPLYVRFTDHVGKIRPYGFAGMAFNLLLLTESQYEYVDITSSGEGDGAAPIEVKNQSRFINRTYKYRPFTNSVILGGGVKVKIGRNYILAEARYMRGLKTLNIEDKYYIDREGGLDPTFSSYSFSPPYVQADNFSFNIGYVHPLYKPRKIKRIKLFSFLKKGGKDA